MVILEPVMGKQKFETASSNQKKTLLLTQDLTYAKNLASNEEKTRRKSLKYLKNYLEQRSKANALSYDGFRVLWKGLFYSMWMSDKPLVQEDCAENISQLIHHLQFDEGMLFFKTALVTLQNEWIGIDQLRLDKFLMFVRRLLRQALFVLKKQNFRKHSNEKFAKVLEETILSTTEAVPLGLFMHFTEIYLEELAKVSAGKLHPSRTIDFLTPFISKLAFANDNRIITWISKFIFTYLMRQHKLGQEYEEKYKVWKAQRFVGSLNQIQKIIVSDPEQSEDDSETSELGQEKPMDPRAGRVNVDLAEILFNAKDLSEALIVPKSDPRTSKTSRKQLTIWSQKFLKLYNGVYPLGIRKLNFEKRKNGNINTNVTSAAKRLIKFEQKLLARDKKTNKRKREHLEDQNEKKSETNTEKPKRKKMKLQHNVTQTAPEEIFNLSPLEHDNNTDELSVASSNGSTVLHSFEKSKKKSGNESLKTKIKKKKLKLTERKQKNSNISDRDTMYYFRRNSGIWYVTPETPAQLPEKRQTTEDNKSTSNEKMNIPSSQKQKSATKLRGKNKTAIQKTKSTSTPLHAEPKTPRSSIGSPKKVVINVSLNKAQNIDDHILQVKSSPQLPWDSSKKPGKPLLKTPIKASPVNPFYTLRK